MHRVLRRSHLTTSPILVRLCLCMKLHLLIYVATYVHIHTNFYGFKFIASTNIGNELIVVVVLCTCNYKHNLMNLVIELRMYVATKLTSLTELEIRIRNWSAIN